jgi:hypothetical protein
MVIVSSAQDVFPYLKIEFIAINILFLSKVVIKGKMKNKINDSLLHEAFPLCFNLLSLEM